MAREEGDRERTGIWRAGDIELDVGQQRVLRGGVPVELPKLSFDMLLALMRGCTWHVPARIPRWSPASGSTGRPRERRTTPSAMQAACALDSGPSRFRSTARMTERC
ncbi:MAG: hypothetical protein DIU62_010140 [Pseudomonadota bacterium]|jgi:hypothetical protein